MAKKMNFAVPKKVLCWCMRCQFMSTTGHKGLAEHYIEKHQPKNERGGDGETATH